MQPGSTTTMLVWSGDVVVHLWLGDTTIIGRGPLVAIIVPTKLVTIHFVKSPQIISMG